MANKKYQLGKDNREKIKIVATQMGNIIGKTLGPGGRNYLLNSGITNDGKTILQSIRFKDETEDQLSLVFQDIASNADLDGGDGTTTATVISTKLLSDILPKVADIDVPIVGNAMSVMKIKNVLEEEKDKAVSLINKKIKKITTLEQLQDVAFTAMEDREIGNKIAQAVWDVGPDGYITMEEGFSGEVEIENVPGIKYPIGVVAPFQYTNNKKEAVLADAPILLANHYFTTLSELNPLLSEFNTVKKFSAFVLIAKGFEAPFIRSVYNLAQDTNFRILLLKTDMSDDEFEDVASYVDAQVFNTSPRIGHKIEDARILHLGSTRRIIAGEKETVFIGGRGLDAIVLGDHSQPCKRVDARIKALKDEMGNKKDTKLDGRIARLCGGIGIIRYDAKTQTEKYYLKLKIEDAKNSCKGALKHGVLRGGGVTLSEIADELGKDSLLYGALKEPYNIIQRNYGEKLEIGENILDAANVTISSLKNAVSVVKILITQEGIIVDEEISMVEAFKNKLLYE